ncbi:MAG: hypothetical protein RL662_2473 [Bacteroidota bacterium]|jgi:ribosome assembly protein YihI (activator of Der GTPase)
MTLDELEEKFEFDELLRRHEAGEKLDDSDYYRLAKKHSKWSDISFPDFEEMTEEYNMKYPIRKQRISAFKWQLNEFEKRIIDLNPNNPVEAIMIDDWNFGKKCRLTIEQLEQEEVLSKPQKADDAIGGIIISTTEMKLENMTLDELEEKFELEELWKRHEAGEKLEYGEYRRLAETTINWNYIHPLPDFEDMKNQFEQRYLDIPDRIVAYEYYLNDFEEMALDLDYNDPIERVMIDDWNFGKKCASNIRLLEAMLRSKSFNTPNEKHTRFSVSLSKEQLTSIYNLLVAKKFIEADLDTWIYWFNPEEVNYKGKIRWLKRKTALANMLDIISLKDTKWKPVAKLAFEEMEDIPNQRPYSDKEKEEGYVGYPDKSTTQIYDILKEIIG